MSKDQKKKAVYIPADLYDRIDERARSTEFGTVEEYVKFVMEEVLKDEDDTEVAFTKEEEEEVKKRLKALGYLD